jgi:hypothetical protein
VIFNDEMIFIHIGKTGGMSCSHYLLRALKPPVYYCHGAALSQQRLLDQPGLILRDDVGRHCTLREGLEFIARLNGKGLDDFRKVVAVIRHPYTLEYSYYRHLQKPKARRLRKGRSRRPDGTPSALALAEGDFRTFVEHAGYHRPNHPQEKFFRLKGRVPDKLELVRFEELSTAFPEAVQPFCRDEVIDFPHRNQSAYGADFSKVMTDDVRALIHEKHRYMFDQGYYPRSLNPGDPRLIDETAIDETDKSAKGAGPVRAPRREEQPTRSPQRSMTRTCGSSTPTFSTSTR